MISAVIRTCDSADALGPTLGALGEAVMSGLLRDVIFADRGSSDDTEAVAEIVGATFARAGEDALAQARGDWLLLLDADAALSPGWAEAARRHIRARPQRAACFGLRVAGGVGLGPALLDAAARALGRAAPAQGLLTPRGMGVASRRLARLDAHVTLDAQGWRARGGLAPQARALLRSAPGAPAARKRACVA